MQTYRDAIEAGAIVARHGRHSTATTFRDASVALVPIRPATASRRRADAGLRERDEVDCADLGGIDVAVMCHERIAATRPGLVQVGPGSGPASARTAPAILNDEASGTLETCSRLSAALLAQTTFFGRRIGAPQYS